MALFGFDLSEMTDAQIEAGIGRVAKTIAGAGIPTADARDGFVRVRNAITGYQPQNLGPFAQSLMPPPRKP